MESQCHLDFHFFYSKAVKHFSCIYLPVLLLLWRIVQFICVFINWIICSFGV
jgi:hypothetical protein